MPQIFKAPEEDERRQNSCMLRHLLAQRDRLIKVPESLNQAIERFDLAVNPEAPQHQRRPRPLPHLPTSESSSDSSEKQQKELSSSTSGSSSFDARRPPPTIEEDSISTTTSPSVLDLASSSTTAAEDSSETASTHNPAADQQDIGPGIPGDVAQAEEHSRRLELARYGMHCCFNL